METKFSWNQVARQGAVLGIILAASSIFEWEAALSGKLGWMGLIFLEWIAVVVLHYYLLNRYTKQYGAAFSAEEGFPFWRAYGYLLNVSLFAGVVVGAVQALYLHAIVGYSNYMARYVEMMKGLIAQMSSGGQQMAAILRQTMEQMQQAEAPSIISTAFSGIWSVVLFGLLFGLLCAVPYFFIGFAGGGLSQGLIQMMSWWVAGIPFDLIHGVSNFAIMLALYRPISNLLRRMPQISNTHA